MSTIKIFDSEQITMWYYPDKKIIHHQMHKYTYGQVYRDTLMTGLETMKKYGACKWLSDDRKNPVLAPDDQKWGIEVWFPSAIEAGWKYWAIIQPDREIAKTRMERIADGAKLSGLTVQIFSNVDDAMAWLEQQQKPL